MGRVDGRTRTGRPRQPDGEPGDDVAVTYCRWRGEPAAASGYARRGAVAAPGGGLRWPPVSGAVGGVPRFDQSPVRQSLCVCFLSSFFVGLVAWARRCALG